MFNAKTFNLQFKILKKIGNYTSFISLIKRKKENDYNLKFYFYLILNKVEIKIKIV